MKKTSTGEACRAQQSSATRKALYNQGMNPPRIQLARLLIGTVLQTSSPLLIKIFINESPQLPQYTFY